MNKRDFEKWCDDFSIRDDQREKIKDWCSNAVKKHLSLGQSKSKDSQKRINNLLSAINTIKTAELHQIAWLSTLGEKGAIFKIEEIENSIRAHIEQIKTHSLKAKQNYEKEYSKGGRPEQGRALALQVAVALVVFADMRPTTTPDKGAFDRLLIMVFQEAGVANDTDLKSVRDYAVKNIPLVMKEFVDRLERESDSG